MGNFPQGILKNMRVPLRQVQTKSLESRSAVAQNIQGKTLAARPNAGAD